MAFGNECGIAIVDLVQKCILLNMGTPDLYGNHQLGMLFNAKLRYDRVQQISNKSNMVTNCFNRGQTKTKSIINYAVVKYKTLSGYN